MDPPAFLPVPADGTVVDDPRFFLTVSADGRYATVCRLVGLPFDEVVAHASNARITWITDGSHEPELRALGCRDQDPPLSSYVTALATEEEPPAVPGVDVRRVDSYEEFLTALDVSNRGWGTPTNDDAHAIWARHEARPGGDWVAFVEGVPVAYAGAIAGAHGLFLTGGVTVPEARGRGAYRALVRARWDEAVRLGTPALVVHAEEASRRVLARIGFREVGAIVELVSGGC